MFFEEAKISELITNYYRDLFASKETKCNEIVNQALHPCIEDSTNIGLVAIPSAREVRDALFSIHPDKAPGPDGFSASFFRSNWKIMGSTIISEIQGFFSSGTLPNTINHTYVRLIPKISAPKKVADYQPIALCKVYYKIFSKILTRRLQPVLNSLISETQSAFVPGRAISDNVMITHETLHSLKRSTAKKHCSMAEKTDMSKAYDRLEWNFIEAVLLRLGFYTKWVGLIMQCITTVTYSYLINDSAHGIVTPRRGIR